MPHGFCKLGLAPSDVAFGGFIQIIVEGLLHVAHVAFFDQQLGEVRASRHLAAMRLHLFERDIHAKLPEPRDQADIAVTARGLQIANPPPENI